MEHFTILCQCKTSEEGLVFAHMLGSTPINLPIVVTLDNIGLIIDYGYKAILRLSLLVAQSVLALSNSTISLLVVQFIGFLTNDLFASLLTLLLFLLGFFLFSF